jgi:hypothetical protein
MPLTLKITLVLLLTINILWSADEIIINEIMYNSPGTDVEFVELFNRSSSTVNLEGWYILDDNDSHTHCLLTGNLAAGNYLVIAGNNTLFRAAYPTITNVNSNDFDTGTNAWALGNGGDAVRLFNSANQLQDIVIYGTGGDWPASPDGNGPSLELLNPALDNALPASWDPSQTAGGTPGRVNSVLTDNVAPICKDGTRNVTLPTHSDAVKVSVRAYDPEGLSSVELMINTGQGYTASAMNDNGTNGDAKAGDSTYTGIIPAQSSNTIVKYYAVATDDIGQQDTWPNNAPAEYHAYTVDYTPPKLRITEILAVNDAVNQDEAGEYDDWLEIHNEDNVSVNIGGMFVSNSFGDPRQFQLPSLNLATDEYVIVWTDNDVSQGSLHANFKLSSEGETVALFETVDHGNVLIHGWKFGIMRADISMGFKPMNTNTPEYLLNPTPGASNETSSLFSSVCINEFQSTSAFGGPDDWVEIYNRGTTAFDLSGCYLSDQRGKNTKWKFPANTILQPNNYLVIYEDALGFGFSSEGDDVIMLSAADSTTGLDFFDFGPQQPDHSEGRYPDGVGNWCYFNSPTKGVANSNPSWNNYSPNSVPAKVTLFPNYPNPFNPSTNISFTLSVTARVSLTIYDIAGHEVVVLVNGVKPAGYYTITFHAEHLPGGIYFARLVAGSHSQTRKMLLIK